MKAVKCLQDQKYDQEFVSFGDKNPAMKELVIETDTSEYGGLKNKMKEVLPCVSTNGGRPYTYFIEKYEDLTQEEFSGAPQECFNAEFRINLHSEEDFNNWITAFLSQVSVQIIRLAHIN